MESFRNTKKQTSIRYESCKTDIKDRHSGTREMAQWLKALGALGEDSGSVLQHSHEFQMIQHPLLASVGLHACSAAHTYR